MDAFKEMKPVNYGEHGIYFAQSKHIPGGLCFPAHWHDRVELLHIEEGSLRVQLGGKSIVAKKGQLVLIMPRMAHAGHTGQEGLVCNMIAFDPKCFLNQTCAAAKYIQPILRHEVCFCSVTSQEDIISIFERLSLDLRNGTTRNPLCLQADIYTLLGLFQQYCIVEQGVQTRLDEKFDKILEYIDEHFVEDISTGSLSRQFGYDEAYFCRRFKGITGITAKRYIRILRMEKAQRMIQTCDEDIKEIALLCGFSEYSYFSNCYKKHFGIAPKDSRQKEI